MARRKKGRAIHGWLVLDKPAGMTSTQAVGAARRLFDARKAGHAGTLDPLATGVLPIAFGEATKTVPYAVEGAKHYRFTVRWGAATNTDDAEGQIIAESELRPSRAAIEALLPRFTGEILQVPPAFSAIKVDGNRAYDLARSGEAVTLEARRVMIDWLTLLEVPDREQATFEARCGKGTYVRALARDMGAMLGCHGHLIALRRTRVAPFDELQAVDRTQLEAAATQGDAALKGLLLPIEAALRDLLELTVAPNDAARLSRGQPVLIRGRDAATATGPTYATCRGQLIAVGRIEKGELHPLRVFNFSSPG
ncbi:MAG: tRNA pseudouridine(55) synthase TruB, partial [Hyphomicrobiaceae bacterium]|nr:tRNA pseudouridine(55) synthase TruB [Hyphomicrobiaceae bacterium]